jgi:TetR/AcrR family transcriptional repressor of nem operon
MARLREFDEDVVLEAATQFFWKNGCEATSMRDLADHTGMTIQASIREARHEP